MPFDTTFPSPYHGRLVRRTITRNKVFGIGLGRTDKVAPVEPQAPVRLISQQKDAAAELGRGAIEQIGQRLQRVAVIDAAGRIMRRVDDDQPGLWSDRAEIEVECRGLQSDLARYRIG